MTVNRVSAINVKRKLLPGPVYTDAYSLDTLSYSVKTEQLIRVYTIVFDENGTIDFCLHGYNVLTETLIELYCASF